MGEIFAYSLVSGLLLLVMYPVYKWLLAGERQHEFNRGILWTIYLAALLLPLVSPSLRELAGHLMRAGGAGTQAGTVMTGLPEVTVADDGGTQLPRILLWVYLGGIVLTLAYTAMTALRLRTIIKSGESLPCGRYRLVLTECDDVAPFSWLRYIVISRRDYESSGRVIVIHETRHLEMGHWVDMVMAQCVAIFMWYNPVAWLMREALKSVHEYQADEAVMTSGADLREYQMLLVKKAVGARFPSLANSLNHSKLKKRITMMHKDRSNVVRRMWALALFPAAAVAVAVAGTPAVSLLLSEASAATLGVSSGSKGNEKTLTEQTEGEKSARSGGGSPVYYLNGERLPEGYDVNKIDPSEIASMTIDKSSGDTEIFIEKTVDGEKSPAGKHETIKTPEVMPKFTGGEQAMIKWLTENIRYPEEAMKTGTEGRVIVRFTVSKTGRVSDPGIVRSVSPALDAEALRVVSAMPAWTPGTVDGKPVACQYVLPVSFSLTADDEKGE